MSGGIVGKRKASAGLEPTKVGSVRRVRGHGRGMAGAWSGHVRGMVGSCRRLILVALGPYMNDVSLAHPRQELARNHFGTHTRICKLPEALSTWWLLARGSP